jgi:protein O-mannosyl-transferase
MPSMGAFTLISTACVMLSQKRRKGDFKILGVFMAAIMLALMFATLSRNEIWKDNVTLWQDAVEKSPGKVRPYNNLGAALSDVDRNEEAIRVLKRAISIKPDHPEAYYNLGRLYLIQGKMDDAITLLGTAIKLKPDYNDAYVNLAAVYIRVGRVKEAIALLEHVLPSLDDRPDVHFNLGVAFYVNGDVPAAMRELAALERLDTHFAANLATFIGQSRRAR